MATMFRDKVVSFTMLLFTTFLRHHFSSHEVFVDQKQMDWFEQQLSSHPAEDGWIVLVFSHAPPMGSGLRVVQGVHIRNQCAWLNHR